MWGRKQLPSTMGQLVAKWRAWRGDPRCAAPSTSVTSGNLYIAESAPSACRRGVATEDGMKQNRSGRTSGAGGPKWAIGIGITHREGLHMPLDSGH